MIFADSVLSTRSHLERKLMPGRGLQAAATRLAGSDARRALIVIFITFTALVAVACSKSSSGKTIDSVAAARPLSVRAMAIAMKPIRRNIESVGSLFAFEEVTVSSEVEGRVERVLADVGDRVSSGQPLVKVAPAELELTLEQQRAALRQARARPGINDDNDDLKDLRTAAEGQRPAADLAHAEQEYPTAQAVY